MKQFKAQLEEAVSNKHRIKSVEEIEGDDLNRYEATIGFESATDFDRMPDYEAVGMDIGNAKVTVKFREVSE